jgi:hypothetical protein
MRLLIVALLVAGCGSGSTVIATGGSGGASGGTGGGTGGATPADAATGTGGQADAASPDGPPADAPAPDAGADAPIPVEGCRTDSDCPPIQCLVPPCDEFVCVLGADGTHQCRLNARPAPVACTEPSPDPSFRCCLSQADCTMQPHGHCIPWSYNHCAGPPPLPGNTCVYDACTSDADCTAMPNGFCTAGFPRFCLSGPCRSHADCNRGPGGRCVMETIAGGWCPRPTVFCRYSNDPCRVDADCKGASVGGLVCSPRMDLHGTMCVDRGPPPP